MSTIKVTNLQNASAASPAIVLDANSRATLNGLSYPTEGSLSGRNAIINGAMGIDQRNAGAAITGVTSAVTYICDRWYFQAAGGATVTVQQSTTAPAGFNRSSYATVTSSGTPGYGFIQQNIEGSNITHLNMGDNNSRITISFWVRSSIQGTYSVSVQDSTYGFSYNATYSISAANTWEYKSVTVPGYSSGTWNTTNTQGMAIRFALAPSGGGTANTWVSGSHNGSTNNVNWFGTNGATFYITGVQLELGSVATPFERRSYGQELALCQRYYQQIGKTSSSNDVFAVGYTSTNQFFGAGFLRASMRAAPTFSYSGTLSDLNYTHPAVSASVSSISSSFTNTESYSVILNSATGTTNGFGAFARCVTANVAVTFTAEL